MEYIVRIFLFFHGCLLGKQGVSYINNPRNEVFLNLLKNEGLEGPGLDIVVPFVGISYLTIGVFNILAGIVFSVNEACYTLMASGLMLHIGMATVRATLDRRASDLYKPGMLAKTNKIQYGMGIVCTTIGIIGLL